MRRKQPVGTKYDEDLDGDLDRNQNTMVDELITPHFNRIPEMKGGHNKIVASVAAYEHDAQPVQARGRIVWSQAYRFQPKGPSYLDGTYQ